MNSEVGEVSAGNVRLTEEPVRVLWNSGFSRRVHAASCPSPPGCTSVFTSAEEMSEEQADIPNELLGEITEKLANGDKLRRDAR